MNTSIISSFCSGGACVKVTFLPSGAVVVSNTNASGGVAFTPEEWDAFVAGTKAGEFDLPPKP